MTRLKQRQRIAIEALAYLLDRARVKKLDINPELMEK